VNALKDAENGKKHPALIPKNVASRNSLGRKEIEFYARCLIAADVYRAHSGISRPNAQATILKRKDVIAAAKIRDIDLPGTDHLRHSTMEGWRRHLRERSSSHRTLPLFGETVRGRYDELLQKVLRSLLRGERLQQFKDCTSTQQRRFGRYKDLQPLLRGFSTLKIESKVSHLFEPSLTNGTDFSPF